MGLTRVQRFLRHGSLSQLAAFEAVARLNSFTRAAESLHMAQPTVSQHIRKLSESVGQPLFEQVGRQIKLTAAGSLLYEAAADIFQTLERFDARAQAIETVATGTLRLAVCEEASTRVVQILERFMQCHPDVMVRLLCGDLAQLRGRMSANDDDLYLMAGLPSGVGVVRQRVAPLELVLVAPAGHPLAGRPWLDLAEVLSYPFVLQQEGSAVRALLDQAFAAIQTELQVRMIADDAAMLGDAVASGLGLGVLTADAAAAHLAAGKLTALDAAGFPDACECCFAYPVGKRLSAAARAFLSFARQLESSAPIPLASDPGARRWAE